MLTWQVLVGAALTATMTAAIQIWEKPGDIPSEVPARCRAALVQNITCSDFLLQPQKAAQGEVLVGEAADVYCSDQCSSSITKFQKSVTTGCDDTLYPLVKNSTMLQSGKAIVDGLAWAHKLVCIKDR